MTQQAPGWYPDPNLPDSERYWNGGAWTNDVRKLGTAKARRKGWLIAVGVAVVALAGYITFSAITGFGSKSEGDETAAATTTTGVALTDDQLDERAAYACTSAVEEKLGNPPGIDFVAVRRSTPDADVRERVPWIVFGYYTTDTTTPGTREGFRCEVLWDEASKTMTPTVTEP